jgi:hypothetical protein
VIRIAAVVALSALFLAACASSAGKWDRANTSPDEVAANEVECRTAARQDVEDRLSARGGANAFPPSADNRNVTGNWTNMMDQFSAEKRERQVFERCMTQRGFQFVPFSD